MLTPTEFEQEYSDREIEEKLLDRQIASVQDIQYLYGQLYTLATSGTDKYAPYLTPNDSTNLFDEENSLLAIKVDLSGDSPRLDSDTPVEIRAYKKSLVEKVSLSAYPNKGRGIEHSITHKTGSNKTRTDMIGYATDRLQKWPTKQPVKDLIAEHKDGWIIRDLITLGKNKTALRELGEHIYRNFDDKRRSLVTVRIKTHPNGEYQWPGELEVIKEGMKRLYENRLISKNKATNSQGQASDMVTDEMTTTVGTSGDPLNHYLTKQLEKFPNFDPDESWRTHSISGKTAVIIKNSTTFIEECSQRQFNGFFYYLPYITGEMKAADAKILYQILYQTVQSEDITPIEQAYLTIKQSQKNIKQTGLRFYVSMLQKQQNALYDVYHQELSATVYYPIEIANAHEKILCSWVYDVDDTHRDTITPPLPENESWNLLNPRNFIKEITNGSYFFFSMIGDSSHISAMETEPGLPDSAIPNDDRVDAYIPSLTGGLISVERLLKNYVSTLIDKNKGTFPSMDVAGQFAQLNALAEVGLLHAEREITKPLIQSPKYTHSQHPMPSETDQQTANPDDQTQNNSTPTKRQLREEKLTRFIDETPALKNDERLSAFLVGVMVGQVSSYQSVVENLGQTLVDQYSISSVTKPKIQEITTKALDKNQIYSRKNHLSSPMYGEVVEKITQIVGQTDPTNWSISVTQTRFYYSLGVSYGQQNWASTDTDNEPDPQEK